MKCMSTDKALSASPQYVKICETIEKLNQSGILARFAGQCVSCCDLVQNLLYQVGIESEIVEVSLSVVRAQPDAGVPEYTFIGFDSLTFGSQIDTHTVLITKTDIPVLLDLSVAHILDLQHQYVLERFDANRVEIFAEYNLAGCQLVYQLKKTARLPHLHQKTIMARMIEDQRIASNFKLVSRIAV